MNIDVLVFCAHPDDAEISMGGTIAKLSKNNLKIGIIDLTQGELGTRGNAETRQKEAFVAAGILKVAFRENFGLPDGNIQVNNENVLKLIKAIRKYKPKIIFAPYYNDRHPDHMDTSNLVKRAYFACGLPKIKTFEKEKPQEAYRPKKLFYFMHFYRFNPSFIIDISDTFENKMQAITAYSTQFFNPKSVEPETFISQPNFLKFIESRAQVYGFRIGKTYGEPFFCEEDIELDLINMLHNKNPK
ncbi:MAG: bacillithiol biosynthesis deacetylase BshB1 [Ignavibacteriales bacterium]|nr:bacillithiol biosynthesis deacetylase BshB1 [Ignavibacteriales bacterium]